MIYSKCTLHSKSRYDCRFFFDQCYTFSIFLVWTLLANGSIALQISNGQGLTKESHNSMPRSMPERPTMKTLRLSTKGPVIEVCSEYLNRKLRLHSHES